jgi:hypothetical protein
MHWIPLLALGVFGDRQVWHGAHQKIVLRIRAHNQDDQHCNLHEFHCITKWEFELFQFMYEHNLYTVTIGICCIAG